ncbi:MAG: class I SAM-dependent methyltransferase [Methanobacterium sp.]|nr:class I SAM-dependent methyltransferase [Methanobacterium sp.]
MVKKIKCRICGNSQGNSIIKVKEMMFGLREEFDYLECNNCGCLQICQIPEVMGKYYPENYYSLKNQDQKPNFLIRNLIRKRNQHYIYKNSILGRLIQKIFPNPFFSRLGELDLDHNSRILDVGSGGGLIMNFFSDLNFKKVTGIDPFLDKEIKFKNLELMKKEITEMPDDVKYDLIMFNHSLEHISNQQDTINKVSQLLTPDGTCIIWMPVKTDYIWDLYRADWVQIDAPRHFYLHTLKSLEILLGEDLILKDVIFDSYEFQFWGSEQYKKNIPLESENSYLINPKKSIFSQEEIKQYRRQAAELNQQGRGDSATFIIHQKS